jgi:hypothetical protein
MVATAANHGVVYDTGTDKVGDHLVQKPGAPPDEQHHAAAKLFGAIAEHSSPATPVAQPNAYTTLAQDFSSCCLPYSQPLDVERSYLFALETTRYSTMRHFRKDRALALRLRAVYAPQPSRTRGQGLPQLSALLS